MAAPGRPSDEDQLAKLVAMLRQRGGRSGNYALIRDLVWKEDEYWRIRQKAIELGHAVPGRGRGGSVRLVEKNTMEDPKPVAAAAPKQYERESGLYAPCRHVLESAWREERGLQEVHVDVTAHQGSKATGGDWTRPDLAALSMRTFRHWPGRSYDLWTFEIKPAWEFSVTGIFEAAAHSRSATYSYAMFHVPGGVDAAADDVVERYEAEAQRFGVGLLFLSDPTDFKTWDTRVEPVRRQPDPALLERFVATQMTDTARGKLALWSK